MKYPATTDQDYKVSNRYTDWAPQAKAVLDFILWGIRETSWLYVDEFAANKSCPSLERFGETGVTQAYEHISGPTIIIKC